MSITREDFPEPETPDTVTIFPKGKRKSTAFKLCPVAPQRLSHSAGLLSLRVGTAIRFAPERYCPVSERGLCMISSGVPMAITSPPSSPAPGPRSTTKSALRIASSSCSTTINVLPKSRNSLRLSRSLSLSRWCSPILGSSSTYITPVKPDPICPASRVRCASPPDRESVRRSSDK